jgi:septal ring factor EnvC (AmiA/AmiB activator)
MTTMVAELYDALIAAGTPDDKARKAAEARAGYEAYDQRLGRIESDTGELKRDVADLRRAVSGIEQQLVGVDRRVSGVEQQLVGVDQRVSGLAGDVLLLKWMIGFVLAFQVALFIKLFLH